MSLVIVAPLTSCGQAAPQTTADPATITFAPPLDTTLRYLLTKSQSGEGQAKSTTLELFVRYVKTASGYRMTYYHRLPPKLRALGTHPGMSALLRPITLLLDDNGVIVGMVDEEGYWDALGGALGSFSEGLVKREARFASSATADMRKLPAETRFSLIAQDVRPLLALASLKLPPGKPIDAHINGLSPFGTATEATSRTMLEKISNGTAFVTVVTEFPPANSERLLAAVRKNFEASGDPVIDPPRGFRLPIVVERAEYRVLPKTGLATHYVSRKTIEPAGASASSDFATTVTLELKDHAGK